MGLFSNKYDKTVDAAVAEMWNKANYYAELQYKNLEGILKNESAIIETSLRENLKKQGCQDIDKYIAKYKKRFDGIITKYVSAQNGQNQIYEDILRRMKAVVELEESPSDKLKRLDELLAEAKGKITDKSLLADLTIIQADRIQRKIQTFEIRKFNSGIGRRPQQNPTSAASARTQQSRKDLDAILRDLDNIGKGDTGKGQGGKRF